VTWVSVKQIEDALNAADFPAAKDELVAQARAQGTTDDVLQALQSLPPQVAYANLDEVIRSVHVDVGTPPTAEQKALRARESRSDQARVTERLRPPT
jgi:hypothetical protein